MKPGARSRDAARRGRPPRRLPSSRARRAAGVHGRPPVGRRRTPCRTSPPGRARARDSSSSSWSRRRQPARQRVAAGIGRQVGDQQRVAAGLGEHLARRRASRPRRARATSSRSRPSSVSRRTDGERSRSASSAASSASRSGLRVAVGGDDQQRGATGIGAARWRSASSSWTSTSGGPRGRAAAAWPRRWRRTTG